jgi:rhodanese-related sulfurtransferase/DNA-binding transcriptional ArsR family regulator
MAGGDRERRKRRFKDAVYGAVARVPAALANRHRLELLDLISQAPRTVQDLAAETRLSVANASQHLRILAEAGLVSVERRGVFKLYRASDPAVYRLLVALRSVAESADGAIVDAERAYGGAERDVETLDAAREVLGRPGTTLLDVRPPDEYAVAHLPGAINVPLDALRRGTASLPDGKRYVVYCRGPYCVFADEAVALLRKSGLEAKRLALGPVEWLAAGGEVQRVG